MVKLNDLSDLIKYCLRINEPFWVRSLEDIENLEIEDFNDLECHLMDHRLVDFHDDLLSYFRYDGKWNK